MEFKEGAIEGVTIKPLKRFTDDRGWLIESFRQDELSESLLPTMAYTSETLPGVSRGPHEHVEQTDFFIFLGPGTFRLYLWDNRKDSPTYMNRQVVEGGENHPLQAVVPPGVAHAYRNIGNKPAVAHNFPNRLYKGQGKRFPVDEIRHEEDVNTPFKLE